MIAAILNERGDTKEAIDGWRKVLDIDPQHRLARRRLEECKEKIEPPSFGVLRPED